MMSVLYRRINSEIHPYLWTKSLSLWYAHRETGSPFTSYRTEYTLYSIIRPRGTDSGRIRAFAKDITLFGLQLLRSEPRTQFWMWENDLKCLTQLPLLNQGIGPLIAGSSRSSLAGG